MAVIPAAGVCEFRSRWTFAGTPLRMWGCEEPVKADLLWLAYHSPMLPCVSDPGVFRIVYLGLGSATLGMQHSGDGAARYRSKSQDISGVWLFPSSYLVHLAEEYFVAGGFPRWVEGTFALRFSTSEFVAWNAFGLAFMCVGVWLVSRDPKFRFVEIALAIALLCNVVAHVLASAVTWTYSPGLVTGIVIWTPLATVRVRSAWQASSHRGRRAGTYLGITVVLITLAVVASGPVLNR